LNTRVTARLVRFGGNNLKRLIALSLLLACTTANAVTYNVAQLSALSSGQDATAYGMNDNGMVVGNAYNSSTGQIEAVVWNGGVVQSLGFQGIARAVNNSGTVVGEQGVNGTQNRTGDGRAYMWDSTNGYQDIGSLIDDTCVTYCYSGAYDINESGVITGNSFSQDFQFGITTMHAFRYENGSMTDLVPPNPTGGYSRGIGINDNGVIIGRAAVDTFQNSDKYMGQWDASDNFYHDTPPGNYSSGRDINNNNIAVGISRTGTDTPNQAAYWDALGNVTIFAGTGGQLRSRFSGVNDNGVAVGAYEVAEDVFEAIISFDGTTIVNLNDIIDLTGTNFVSLDEAFDINAAGDIVGVGTTTTGESAAFYLTAVPVPAAVWLFASALGLLGWKHRRAR
jgi:probable HAF family extracellular repeat protein